MSKIIAMVGISGSGKSTRAKEIMDAAKGKAIIVSRDKIREMLFGYTEETIGDYYKSDFMKKEPLVSKVQDSLIRKGIALRKDVIVDNTHLKMSYLNDLAKYGVVVETVLCDELLSACLARDAKRTRTVGKAIIRQQWTQFVALYEIIPSHIKPKDLTIKQDETLDCAYIFDIDGTLAHMMDRSPYDYDKVDTDTRSIEVAYQLKLIQDAGNKIIICTGRDGVCTEKTLTWLGNNGIAFDEFYIRPEGSKEPDFVVKERMWRDIVQNYYIVGMFDDRNQVVDHARQCGFNVFQVAEGNF